MSKDERLPAPAPGLSGINRTIRARSPATDAGASSPRLAHAGSPTGTLFDENLDSELADLLGGDVHGSTAFGLATKDADPGSPPTKGASTRFGVQSHDVDHDGIDDWHAPPSGIQSRTQLGLDRDHADAAHAPRDIRELVRDLPESWENDVSVFLREHSAPSGVRIATVPDGARVSYAGEAPATTNVPIDKGQATQYGVANFAILKKKRAGSSGSGPAASRPSPVSAPVVPAAPASVAEPATPATPVAATPSTAAAAVLTPSRPRTGAQRSVAQSATPTLNVAPDPSPRLGGPATQSLDMRQSSRRDTQPIDLRTADARFANIALHDDTPPQPAVAPREPKTVADEDLPYAVQQAMRDARTTASALDAVVSPTTTATPGIGRATQIANERDDRDYGEASFSATLNIQDVDIDAIRNAPLDPPPAASPAVESPRPTARATDLFSDDDVSFTRPVAVAGGAAAFSTAAIFDEPPAPPRMPTGPVAVKPELPSEGDKLDFSEIAFADTMRPAPAQPPTAAAAFAARLRASGEGPAAPAVDVDDIVTLSPNPPVDTVRMPELAAMSPRQQPSGRQPPERPMRGMNPAVQAPPQHKTSAEWLSTNKMVVVIAVVALFVALLTILTLARG